jgi:methylmalonyl-CoA mutase cobalamin-binding domain/chain
MPRDITDLIVELEREQVLEAVRERAAAEEDPLVLLEECRQGMLQVGQRFQGGDYYLAELMISGEIFKEAMAILEPYLELVRGSGSIGTVVLATMHGDIHDLGKNIVATLLRVHNFEVHDLGVNVEPEALVEKVKEVSPDIVGFSSLITTSFESTRRAAELLVQAGLREQLKIVVGGGVTTPEFGEYVGADFQTLDASIGVAYCLEACSEARPEVRGEA